MYYILTNMEKGDSPIDKKNFYVMRNVTVKEFKESIWMDLVVYYSLYNEKHVKLFTVKNNEWFNCEQYKILSQYIKNLKNSRAVVNYGHKYNVFMDVEDTLPLTSRLLASQSFTDKVNYYINTKWINELD